jgi:Cu(I)/Ag(I) efflux system membrane fusion protein
VAGRVEVDERRLYAVAPKFEGWVERLFVNATGEPVTRGQPLFEVYSPELVSAQREYAIASQAVKALKDAEAESQASMRRLAESSLARLRNWDISDEQVQALAQSSETRRTLTFRSPATGIVMEKKAIQGMRFMPGEALYQIADLSAVWVIADVYEQDIGLVRPGTRATVRINAYPDRRFEGRIAYVYPTLKPETRTIPVRLEMGNPGLLLKPAMFAQVELPVGGGARSLTVPTSAVIDSGTRQIVLVQLAEGRFEPREVRLGTRADQHVQVLEGVKEGERVVVSANFLIDAESNLRAAIGGFGQPAAAAPGEAKGASPGSAAPAAKAFGVGHRADGTIKAIDAKAGRLSIAHGPIASLNWPAMTMDFKPANEALLGPLKPGMAIIFEFVERAPGEWVVTRVAPAGGTAAPAAAAKSPAAPAAPAHQH